MNVLDELVKEQLQEFFRISIKKLGGLPIEDNGSTESNKIQALTINLEMNRLGFTMSKELINLVETFPEEALVEFHQLMLPVLEKMVGADVAYTPMYPNFPQQVMEASDVELYVNAILHYWTWGLWKPEYETLARDKGIETVQLKTINVVDPNDFLGLFTQLLSSNDSLSEEDKKIVEWFLDNIDANYLLFPATIPFKENMCIVAGRMLQDVDDLNVTGVRAALTKLIKTTTDVLRVATFMSGGDVSLAENTKFVSLPRRQRKILVQLLELVLNEEDINRHRGKWVKLFHSLHVGEYSKRVFEVAKKFRNNEHVETFNSKVQALIDKGESMEAAWMLVNRPGDFARRLDHLLRLNDDKAVAVAKVFSTAAKDVSTRVLLQLLGHFKARNGDGGNVRVVFPKGNTQRAKVLREPRSMVHPGAIDVVLESINSVLVERFSSLPKLGNVWIDPELANCPLPAQQRSASEGLFSVARGTRLPIGDDKSTLRFFVYWVGRDIDLSASLHDENFKMIEHISYTNLRSHGYEACHSGDIIDGSRGACEFIDITIDGAVKAGARYVAMSVYVFSGPTFAEHEKCHVGWMTRSQPKSNEIFDPQTVEQKIDLTSNSRNAVPVLFDLVERKAIWVDLTTFERNHYYGNNVESNQATIEEVARAITSLDNKATLLDLFTLHATARGGPLVHLPEEANTVFSVLPQKVSEGAVVVTPFDINTINSEFLT